MRIEITEITILIRTAHTDEIFLTTDLPEGLWPFKNKAVMKLCVAQGTGVEYVKKHFSIEPSVIDTNLPIFVKLTL